MKMTVELALMIIAARESQRERDKDWEKMQLVSETEAKRRKIFYSWDELVDYANHFHAGFKAGEAEQEKANRLVDQNVRGLIEAAEKALAVLSHNECPALLYSYCEWCALDFQLMKFRPENKPKETTPND